MAQQKKREKIMHSGPKQKKNRANLLLVDPIRLCFISYHKYIIHIYLLYFNLCFKKQKFEPFQIRALHDKDQY